MFMKATILSAVALTLLAGSAFAQNAPPPPKPDAPMVDDGPGKRPPPPPPPAPAGEYAGFDIQLGRGAGIHVACGKDDIKTCVEAASPLLEKAQGMMDQGPHGPGAPPPPPPKKP